MKTRPAAASAAQLCANCLVLVGRHGDTWRHTAILDRSRYEVCESPSPGWAAKVYEVERGHGQPVGGSR
ncbi:hypothetical protein [Micromonospora sp. NBC_00858]|uniref:hypothetical protein n=1 Tax=Micromonospora sp. NBC_00858 TaxID=2975979 RepID=UPI003868479E|nr:hypothetical protein OG990_10530 [Micromonospora sp. NBC_00858]